MKLAESPHSTKFLLKTTLLQLLASMIRFCRKMLDLPIFAINLDILI